MTREEALKIIDDNANVDDNSFLFYIHERNLFDNKAYWRFYNAIRVIGYDCCQSDCLSKELTWKIIKTYEWFLLAIGWHFDNKDLYKMLNLPDNYMAFSLRLMTVVDSYIKGDTISDRLEESLNEDLVNQFNIRLDREF